LYLYQRFFIILVTNLLIKHNFQIRSRSLLYRNDSSPYLWILDARICILQELGRRRVNYKCNPLASASPGIAAPPSSDSYYYMYKCEYDINKEYSSCNINASAALKAIPIAVLQYINSELGKLILSTIERRSED
jgi:hypothetical protein